MTKRVAIYARVSTDGQTVDNQLLELRKVAENHGWVIVNEFVDQGVSGAKGRDQRPGFDALQTGAVRRDFDMIMSWSVDRLGRSLQDLTGFLSEIHAKDVDLYLHQQGIDTSTPVGKAMFQMVGVFAEFERSMIQERVRAGLKRARAENKVLGRPKTSAETEEKIRKARTQGKGILRIGKELGVGTSVVQRVVKAMAV
jgi:DNA invertase Pin-like site-specific DNA recombinase